MIIWDEWSPETFSRAQRLKKPVLLLLPSGKSTAQIESAFAGVGALLERCEAVCADRCDRPDIHLRYGDGPALCLLSHSGHLMGRCSLEEVGRVLPRWIEEYEPVESEPPSEGPAWTGAVGSDLKRALPAERPREALAVVLALPEALPVGAVELLLYAGSEWSDAAARGRLQAEMALLAKRAAGGARALGPCAAAARLLWEAHAVLGEASLRRAALTATVGLLRDFYDPKKRAFRHAASADSDFFADENAQAALALLRAASFEPGHSFAQGAAEALAFLRDSAYDPMLGMIHRRRDGGTLVYGLIADNAWAVLAFSEAFLMSGDKAHREFADGLVKFMLQELWDRDNGAFLDRVKLGGDLGRLSEPRRARPDDNAAALEGLWRLHHLKGNMNYKRWLEWGLVGLLEHGGLAAAALARVQDMLTRGRLDLELVGRPGDPPADDLLAALQRHYAPRRIVSFVDPDDQDYILAHQLKVEGGATLFGCIDLKPVAAASSPEGVGGVLKALAQRR